MYYPADQSYTLPTVEPSTQKHELESTGQCRCQKPQDSYGGYQGTLSQLSQAQLQMPVGLSGPRPRQFFLVHSPTTERVRICHNVFSHSAENSVQRFLSPYQYKRQHRETQRDMQAGSISKVREC